TEKRKWDWVALMVEDILPGVMLAWRRECAVQYRPDLTAERLRELLHYDPDSGEFRWIVPRQKIQVGDIAGSRHKNGAGELRSTADYPTAPVTPVHRLVAITHNRWSQSSSGWSRSS